MFFLGKQRQEQNGEDEAVERHNARVPGGSLEFRK